MLGMFVSHYGAHILDRPEREWPSSVVRFTDGRAMPLFVMLSGAGCVFICRSPNAMGAGVVTRRAVIAGGPLARGRLGRGDPALLRDLPHRRVARCSPFEGVAARAGRRGHRRSAHGYRIYLVDDLPKPYIITDDSWWSALPQSGTPATSAVASHVHRDLPRLPTLAFFFVGMCVARLDLRHARMAGRLMVGGLAWRSSATASVGAPTTTERNSPPTARRRGDG